MIYVYQMAVSQGLGTECSVNKNYKVMLSISYNQISDNRKGTVENNQALK